MTRLIEEDIDSISYKLHSYDMELKKTYGYTLEQIARRAVKASHRNHKLRTAVVPVTSGLGIIGGFSRTVCDILKYCKADVFVTEKADVAGIQEAYKNDVDIIFMADDDVCAAFSLNGKVSSDNGYATGMGFAAALEIMMEKVDGEEVLILGAGPVGTAAATYFSQAGAIPVLCDLQEEKVRSVASTIANARIEKSLNNVNKYLYLLDATTTGEFIKENDVSERTKISAPGMPLGTTKKVREKVSVFHNALELGIMTMYFDCITKLK